MSLSWSRRTSLLTNITATTSVNCATRWIEAVVADDARAGEPTLRWDWVNRFNVVMTAPRLAIEAVAVLEQAGCTVHYMAPYPSAAAVAELVGRVQADAILTRQGPVTKQALEASPRLRIVARHGVGVDDVDLA